MNNINPLHDVVLYRSPYPLWVIDNFLKPEAIDKILSNWVPVTDSAWHDEYSMIEGEKNIVEKGMKSLSDFSKMPDVIRELLIEFHSDEFTDYISKLTKIPDLVSDVTMRWSGMRTMLPDSYQLIHSDARSNSTTGLRKELTCLLYLNTNYNRQNDEGCLEIWNDDMTGKALDIEPILNRFVIFYNTDKSYHGVPIVKSERKMITFSIMANQSNSDRSKALFVPRPFDSEKVAVQGLKRSQL